MRLIIFIWLTSVLFAQDLEELIYNLETHNDVKKIQTIKQLQNMGKKARLALPQLKSIFANAASNNNKSVADAALLAIFTIEPQAVHLSATTSLKTKPIKQQRVTIQKENIGGLTILGSSRDFGQRLRYGKRHALIIGINKYQHHSHLSGPNFDAGEVATVLTNRYGFENVIYLCDTLPTSVYNNQDLTIKQQSANRTIYTCKYGGEKIVVVNYVTKRFVQHYLDSITANVGDNDALFLFYAGHGIPGYMVTADGKQQQNSLKLTAIAEQMATSNARHCLMVLDSCFSGSILQSQYRPKLQGYTTNKLEFASGANIDRVFRRRSFQVITAGTGNEAVADQLGVSTKYAQVTGAGEHSPFSAVFLQAIKGLTGRVDGTQLTSDLGYYMMTTLVNDGRIEASQTPRYRSLAGDGDFMFFPAYKVLNPKLLEPLYLTDDSYADLRGSACEALEKFIQKQSPQNRRPLTRSSIGHVSKLLKDENIKVRNTALAFINQAAENYGRDPEFADVVYLLVKMADTQPRLEIHHQIIETIGYLAPHTSTHAVAKVASFAQKLKTQWQKYDNKILPRKVKSRVLKVIGKQQKTTPSNLQQQLQYWLSIQRDYYWLVTDGIKLADKYKDSKQKITKDANLVLDNAAKEYQNARDQRRSYMEQEESYQKCGAYAGYAMELLNEIEGMEKLKARARGYCRLALLERYKIWCSPVPDYRGDLKTVSWQTNADGSLDMAMNQLAITSICLSSDNKKIVSVCSNGTIRVWNAENGVQIAKLTNKNCNSASWSPDNKTIAVGCNEGLLLWTPELHQQRWLSSQLVHNVSWNSRGNYICATNGKRIYLWNENGKNIANFTSPSSVSHLSWAPDSKKIAVCYQQQGKSHDAIDIWEISQSKTLVTIDCPSSVTSLSWSPDSNRIGFGSDYVAYIWNITPLQEVVDFDVRRKDIANANPEVEIFAIAWSSHQRHIACGYQDGIILILDANTGKEIYRIEAHTTAVTSLQWNRDGDKIISGSRDGTVQMWRIPLNEIPSLTFNATSTEDYISDVLWSPDGRKLASAADFLQIWNSQGKELQKFIPAKSPINVIAWKADSKQLACAENGMITVWNSETNETIKQFKNAHKVLSLFWKQDQCLALIEVDGFILEVWDITSNTKVSDCFYDWSGMSSITWHPNGKKFASSSWDKFLCIWDVTTGEVIDKIELDAFYNLAWSPNGKQIACGANNPRKKIHIFDMASQKITKTFSGHEAPGIMVTWNGEGNKLISTSRNKICIWDVVTEKEITSYEFKNASQPRWHPQQDIIAHITEIDARIFIRNIKSIRKIVRGEQQPRWFVKAKNGQLRASDIALSPYTNEWFLKTALNTHPQKITEILFEYTIDSNMRPQKLDPLYLWEQIKID
ncbi:eIF2A-related protein [Candidatus Uabimicrobium amorphum]|uniref:Peptidase C14 caspase domain-containing protein n=1 Tax=Uabimicrobium amorphum TaxID=2596890 RepID=A0A5S9IR66_UABAM|nr:caspase family protein [Candidatus Uabimicrobium amorphum]BBM86217.1 hypothetical protein UABAM_04603 [Candidatus Uabimicrobium amorphum]